jgi:dUTP pyrophosphatase
LLEEPIPFEVGDRCAQIYFEKIQEWEIEEVDVLSDTIRGEGGFGSTGKS